MRGHNNVPFRAGEGYSMVHAPPAHRTQAMPRTHAMPRALATRDSIVRVMGAADSNNTTVRRKASEAKRGMPAFGAQ